MINPFIRSFARRIGRPLRDSQKTLLTSLLPQVSIKSFTEVEDCAKFYRSVSLEIGFGDGEFLFEYAKQNPENLCIGCEPFLNGVTSLLSKLRDCDDDVPNIKVLADDARLLLVDGVLEFFDNIFVICPDPWPKARHHKKRLLQAPLIDTLYKALRKGGGLHMVTDHIGYAESILEAIKLLDASHVGNLSDFILKQDAHWLFTKYQRRGLSMEHDIYYFKLEAV